uniref:Endosome-associated-trafficking regulator 1 n=1 Tax=Sus scrofa TaxID=9823 RepID=A0A8D1GZE5_PIG
CLGDAAFRAAALISDDKLEDLSEANPFSFKEFLKTKNLGLSKEDTDGRVYSKEATRHALGLDRDSPASQTAGYGLDYQQPFFEDPTGAGDLLDEDEDEDEGWHGAYLPSTVEQTHSSRGAASTSPCSTYVSFFSNPSELVGPESLPSWTPSDAELRGSPAGSPGTDFAAHGEALGDRRLRTLQISYEALKDENSKLRRKLTEVQSFSETQTEMVRTLERQLEAKMMKEERDFHDLESAVRQVEQNLELMTVGRRALPAAGGEGRGSSRPGRGVAPRRGPGRPSVGCGGTGAPDPGAGAPAARRRRLLCPRPHVRGTSLCLFVFLPFSLSFSCVRVWGGMAEACGEGRKSRRETEAGSELAPGDSRDTPTTVRAARVPDKTPKGLCAFFPAPATEPQISREGFPLGP